MHGPLCCAGLFPLVAERAIVFLADWRRSPFYRLLGYTDYSLGSLKKIALGFGASVTIPSFMALYIE